MKDTIITARRKKIEINSILACFIIAFLLNVYAVIAYKTPLSELFWSLGYVVVTACVLYGVWVVLRLIVYGIKCLFKKK